MYDSKQYSEQNDTNFMKIGSSAFILCIILSSDTRWVLVLVSINKIAISPNLTTYAEKTGVYIHVFEDRFSVKSIKVLLQLKVFQLRAFCDAPLCFLFSPCKQAK